MAATSMLAAESIREMLAPGTRLDPGRVQEVVQVIEDRPGKLTSLVECLFDEDPAIASRAADALERITRDRPQLAQRWKEALIGLLPESTEKKVRWNLSLTIPRLKLTVSESRRVLAVLNTFLEDPSSIVKTSALHGMADLTRHDPESLPDVLDVLRNASRSGTPAMRARSRILLSTMESDQRKQVKHSSLHMFD
jgi:hypothetical protein